MMYVYAVLDTWCDNKRVSALYANEESARTFKKEHEETQAYDPRYYSKHEIDNRFIILKESVWE
jgi:hypothetical protein